MDRFFFQSVDYPLETNMLVEIVFSLLNEGVLEDIMFHLNMILVLYILCKVYI